MVTRGCPQGSACGPGLWIILYDEILQAILPDGCELLSFADDLVLICWADNIEALELKVNPIVSKIAAWGRKVKLTFNETKTQVCVFTRKQKRKLRPARFVMNGVPLDTVDHLKYLGVIIDSKLHWREHLLYVQKKTVRIMSRLTALARNTWGLSSEATEVVYKAVIESVALYAVEVWSPALKHKWAQRILTQIQRTALLRVAKAYRTVSGDAIQIITGILPLTEKAELLSRLAVVKQTRLLSTEDSMTAIQHTAISQL